MPRGQTDTAASTMKMQVDEETAPVMRMTMSAASATSKYQSDYNLGYADDDLL